MDLRKARLKGARLPAHLAVIPDGNRRWADQNHRPAMEGHREGYKRARRVARFTREIGIHTVTIWAFSTENWRRSPHEVAALMQLYEEWVGDLLGEALEEKVRVVHLGRKLGVPETSAADASAAGFPQGLPSSLEVALREIEEKTRYYDRNVINLAINYGGVDEVQRAFEQALSKATDGPSPRIEDFLDTSGQPHPFPDLVLRTSGEFRFSGFMPLQTAYAEMVFTPKLFPDLTEDDIVEAVVEYSARVRRFGG